MGHFLEFDIKPSAFCDGGSVFCVADKAHITGLCLQRFTKGEHCPSNQCKLPEVREPREASCYSNQNMHEVFARILEEASGTTPHTGHQDTGYLDEFVG